MKTIEFDRDGIKVMLEVPEPIERENVWYEAREYRKAVGECALLGNEPCTYIADNVTSCKEVWIMDHIPRATPEQLKAAGMKERDEKPVECKGGDRVWCNNTATQLFSVDKLGIVGHYRFVLVPDEKPVERMCKTCGRLKDDEGVLKCNYWNDCFYFSQWIPKQTAPPGPPEPTYTKEQFVDWFVYIQLIFKEPRHMPTVIDDSVHGIAAFVRRQKGDAR